MKLKSLQLINFRNYQETVVDTDSDLVCFTGNNGQGKTNLLDAIYYLSFCKSWINSVDSQNIRMGEQFFLIEGEFVKDTEDFNISCSLKSGFKKVIKKNKKKYDRLADHIGFVPLVVISPEDSSLILEGSETRRKFIDAAISQFDKNYLDDLLSYSKALLQRNTLLKQFHERRQFDAESLQLWNDQLIPLADVIHKKRKEFFMEFEPWFNNKFQEISGGKEQVQLVYNSGLLNSSMKELLEGAVHIDRQRLHTTVGIHKDDFSFLIDEKPLKKFGSQGQQKSFLISLKMAQYTYMRKKTNTQPILLLDDVFDKLDNTRLNALLKLVGEDDFGQVFITDTDAERLQKTMDIGHKSFRIYDISESGNTMAEIGVKSEVS